MTYYTFIFIMVLIVLVLYLIFEFVKNHIFMALFKNLCNSDASPILKKIYDVGLNIGFICLLASIGIDPVLDFVRQIADVNSNRVFLDLAELSTALTILIVFIGNLVKAFSDGVRKSSNS